MHITMLISFFMCVLLATIFTIKLYEKEM